MKTWTFYSNHLERVSRSFSFCIAQLRSPQREWIALSYLLFRIVDTIEDSKWENQDQQFSQFEVFKLAILSKNKISCLQDWLNHFPDDINIGEQLLLKDVVLLLNELFTLPENKKQQIQKNVCQMMSGMCHFLKHHRFKGELVLSTTAQLNQYCFFVAGIVGELLTVFFIEPLNDIELNDALLLKGFHFGLFLQKINILKDQINDELKGRNFISSRHELRQSIEKHAIHALAYIKHLPKAQGRTFRLFCAWSLFIGLASLKWIDKSHQENKIYKISKSETMSLVFKLKCIIDSNSSLDKLFANFIPNAAHETIKSNIEKPLELPVWFNKIYPSDLLNRHADELGLLEKVST